MIVYKNKSAAAFAAAVRRNGGEFIANQRVTLDEVASAIDAEATL